MNDLKKSSRSTSDRHVIINTALNTIVSETSSRSGNNDSSNSFQDMNLLGQIYNQGRWTQLEHLIFLAWIIHFGRDWKKIEYHVQTRSSAQSRSHAQKVLRRMDKISIVKEIAQLKNKLKFDPVENKCENLSILCLTDEEYRRYTSTNTRGSNSSVEGTKNKREIKLSRKYNFDEESVDVM